MIKTNVNTATLLFVRFFGIIGGLTGIGHGIFEIMQGNIAPTDIATRIGAFTIIPNYLLTGVASVIVGCILLYWLLFRIQRPRSVLILFVLIICLFLFGGGVAPIIGLLLVCLVATQINGSLLWWRQINNQKSLEYTANSWKYLLSFGSALIIIGILIWLLLTPPGQIYVISPVQYICWACLLIGTIFIVFSIFAGFSYDIKKK